jgi:hypothetical protein
VASPSGALSFESGAPLWPAPSDGYGSPGIASGGHTPRLANLEWTQSVVPTGLTSCALGVMREDEIAAVPRGS